MRRANSLNCLQDFQMVIRFPGITPRKCPCCKHYTNIYVSRLFVLFWNTAVWYGNYVIPCYLSDEMERVQKRVMRIIFSGSYIDALQLSNFKRLSDQRNETCIKTLQKIAKCAGPLDEHLTQSRACVHGSIPCTVVPCTDYICTHCYKTFHRLRNLEHTCI